MKKYVSMVIAVVMLFLTLIITYSLAPADPGVAGQAATAAAKPR